MPTLEELLGALVAKYGPAWTLTYTSVSQQPSAVELRGALPETMHFGCARLALDSGVLVLVDEDHRDAGDFEVLRVTIDGDELERIRIAANTT